MSNIAKQEMERRILSFSKDEWLKTAMVIAKTHRDFERSGIAVTHEEIANCLYALCELGKLESKGTLTDWRHSEIRLSQMQAAH